MITINEYLENLGINKETINELTNYFTIVKFKAGDTILNMGENTGVVYVILDGAVRGYYLDEDGTDITKCFSIEGDWCGIYNYLTTEPSNFYIQALEDCTMAQIEVNTLRTLIDANPVLQKTYLALSKRTFLQLEEKGTSFQRMNAKERYLSFVKKYPDIIERVKQEYIASYLGITPSSLSRIKRDL